MGMGSSPSWPTARSPTARLVLPPAASPRSWRNAARPSRACSRIDGGKAMRGASRKARRRAWFPAPHRQARTPTPACRVRRREILQLVRRGQRQARHAVRHRHHAAVEFHRRGDAIAGDQFVGQRGRGCRGSRCRRCQGRRATEYRSRRPTCGRWPASTSAGGSRGRARHRAARASTLADAVLLVAQDHAEGAVARRDVFVRVCAHDAGARSTGAVGLRCCAIHSAL